MAGEVGEAIARLGSGMNDINEDELAEELEGLEQEALDSKMLTAPTVPVSKVGNEGQFTRTLDVYDGGLEGMLMCAGEYRD